MYLIDGFRRVTLSSVTRVDFSLYRRTRGVIRIDSLGQSTNISPKMTWSLTKSDYSSLCCISLGSCCLGLETRQGNHQNFYLKVLTAKKIFAKILEIGPWVSRINWCKGHQRGSTYMAIRVSDVRSKKG